MKQCPVCKTTYTDTSLRFCLADGTELAELRADEPTAVLSSGPGGQTAGPASDPTIVVSRQPLSRKSNTKLILFVVIGLLLGVAALAALGLAGAAFFYGSAGTETGPTSKPSPAPSASPTPDPEKERLKNEIANIQRRLEEQNKNARSSQKPPADDVDEFTAKGIVDSPGDGFLALRTTPDAERGIRIAKIPHGAEVKIMNCEKNAVVVGGRSGRWCQVEYNGTNGWVFDAWLEY